MREEHLAELAIADVGKRRGENADDSRAVCRRGEHGGLRKEEIAEQDDGTGRKHAVERWTSAAQAGAIDGVVVNQRRRVEELDPGAGGDQGVSVISKGAAGKEQDQRSQPLATSADEIRG